MATKNWPSFLDSFTKKAEEADRQFEQELLESRKLFDTRISKIVRRLSDRVGKRELEVLGRAGMSRKAILRFLALIVDEDGEKTWPDMVGKRKDALRSMAARLDTIAGLAEKWSSEPLWSVQEWAYFAAHYSVLGKRLPEPSGNDPCIRFVIAGMKALARTWRKEAVKMGKLLRRDGDRRVNPGVPLFLVRVCTALRKPKPDHWEELARLLADAFEAEGKSKDFSADWLRKVWKKRGDRLLKLTAQFNTKAPSGVASPLPPLPDGAFVPKRLNSRLGQGSPFEFPSPLNTCSKP